MTTPSAPKTLTMSQYTKQSDHRSTKTPTMSQYTKQSDHRSTKKRHKQIEAAHAKLKRVRKREQRDKQKGGAGIRESPMARCAPDTEG